MKKIAFKGTTIPELLVVLLLLGITMSLSLSLFVTGKAYYQTGSDEITVQGNGQVGLAHLIRDIQETTGGAVRINAAGSAVLLLSARDSHGHFQVYTGASSAYYGAPNWQNWISYYLDPEPGSNDSFLVRKAGVPPGMPALPNDPPIVPSFIPSTWETIFRSSNLAGDAVASDIQGLSVQNLANNQCYEVNNALMVQLISSRDYGGSTISMAPGSTVFGTGVFSPPISPFITFYDHCKGASGALNWMEVHIQN